MTDGLFQGAIFSIPFLRTMTDIPKASIHPMVAKLEKGGVIKMYREGRGAKPSAYCFPELLKAISEMNIKNDV